ncbi:Fic family protein [Methylomonas sp. DH-1]|uniref:Fic family protein n=1 Tax=Methylomonas sp. (strain DH-1) TaxID=1727196 RepID=UPI0007C95EB0|nr:Fic family protein [Methylomonas sp. DH-1]ANE56968.1 cell filamentation protein Fic [Methylomonas sp. DH-1]
MAESYQPPFTITPAIIRLISDISEQLGRLSVLSDQNNLRLRRINRIRTIQGSLAIEGNTLSEAQITAILEGKRVIAPPKDILEARNAIKAYDQFETWQPCNEKHLLQAHQVLMASLLDDAGRYRKGNVGVMNGEAVVHMAPPANRVKKLMGNLLNWLAASDQHPLITSSVFHYEFEFIHPFADGNGRMGRLWQTLILSQWHPLLAQLPVESMIHAQQSEYYQALNLSTLKTDSAPFIEFMLGVILETVESNAGSNTPQVGQQVTPQVETLLKALFSVDQPIARNELQALLSLKDRESFRERYLKPALEFGLVEMTLPDKPTSRLQQYRLTQQGRTLADALR